MGEAILKNNSKKIILFDGVCNLCNGFVQFIVKRDRLGQFYFSSLQSAFAQEIMKQHPELETLDAVIFLNGPEIQIKSDAAIAILSQLPYWSWVRVLRIFPLFLRDKFYDLIAKYRYRLLGKRDECMIPTPELSSRFIS